MFPILSFIATLISGLFPLSLAGLLFQWKRTILYLYLRIHKLFRKGRLDVHDFNVNGKPEVVGILSHPIEIQLESPYPEEHLAKADDKIFIYGVNSKKECFLVNVNRLSNGKSEAYVYLRLANGKTYQLEDNEGFQQSTGEKNVFSCGGLQMYYLCPMRRWRIFYSGYLKETCDETPGIHKMVYVKFSLLWRASSDVYDNTSDMDERNVVESVAREEWPTVIPPVEKLKDLLDFYAQAGVILGNIHVGDDMEGHEVYLFGEKMRYLGDISRQEGIEITVFMGYVYRNGTFVHFGEISAEKIAKSAHYGFVVKPNAEIKAVEDVDVSQKQEISGGRKVEEMKGTVVAERSYAFCGTVLRPAIKMKAGNSYTRVDEVQFHLNGKEGTGIFIRGKLTGTSHRRVPDLLPKLRIPEHLFPMVVAFTEDECQLPEVTGGKGSSLGKLTQLSFELKTFTVPSGVVVTTSSYKEFITEDTLKHIRNLENVLYGNKAGDAKEACQRVQEKIIAAKIPNNIQDNIVKNLLKVFGEKFVSKKFAVRSSATGEDTEQMSAAGQMDTFLGISGLSNILLAVKKCWASQFGFVAVQYKRRYGQSLNSPMAVVIQEMVSCDVAGVIFTCDPVTGNPTKVSIAANFGLGESVVSGSEEPDAIELVRDHADELRIHQVTVGAKSKRIIVTDDGTGLDDIPENERQECCLSTEKALELGKLAIAIEKKYKSRRDIEWGIMNNNVYIFQSRPVTNGTQETDFEIEHEFDGPLRVENDYFSVSHSGEVLPGAMPSFSLDIFLRMFNITWQRELELEWMVSGRPKYFPQGWMIMRNHAMFNVIDFFKNSEKDDPMEKATMVAFFGRLIDDEDLKQATYERYHEENKQMSLWKAYNLFKPLLFSGRRLRKTKKAYSTYRIPVEKFKTSKDIFNYLMLHCCDIEESSMCHIICTQASTLWNMFILTTLTQAKESIDDDVYTDFANLITVKGNVESADVPSSIQSLAYHIKKSIDPKKFKAMNTEDALNWLKTTPSSAGKKFKDFLDKHGHRCLKEFDLSSITWGSEPKLLVPLLQKLVGNVKEDALNNSNDSVMKLVNQLKVPIGYFSKLKLMMLVPLCRKAVISREASKSLLIKSMDGWRKGYRALAKLMVAEGRIPNEDIFYFITLDELHELLETRSPKILAKAYHRQRLYPKMDKYIFPELMKGIPTPINESLSDEKPEEGLFFMKGIPVSQGVAKGYLRVTITLDDAAHLKPGEIMLAYGTDIGWTPYFPSLAGVATELGGLISHGAVVSREYGLPCVAGLHGATRRFQTGDYVLLDGNKGIIQKIQPPDAK